MKDKLLNKYQTELSGLFETIQHELISLDKSDRSSFEQSDIIIFELINTLKIAKKIAEIESNEGQDCSNLNNEQLSV